MGRAYVKQANFTTKSCLEILNLQPATKPFRSSGVETPENEVENEVLNELISKTV